MPGKVNVAGTWKKITGIKLKRSGAWKAITQLYHKESGTWKLYYNNPWPDSMIGFSTTTTSPEAEWTFCDGSGGAPDLTASYPRGATAQAGKVTKTAHTPPGSGNLTTGAANIGAYTTYNAAGSIGNPHAHTFYHNVGSALSQPAFVRLRAFILNKVITDGILLFYRGSSAPNADWDVWSGYDGKYVFGATTTGDSITVGNGTHSHSGTVTFNVNSEGPANNYNMGGADLSAYINHHTHNFTLAATGTAAPRAVQLLPIVANKTNPAIASGIVAFFAGSTVPSGWKLCDGTAGAPDYRDLFVVLNAAAGWTTDTPIGSDTHTDSCPASTSAAANPGGGSSSTNYHQVSVPANGAVHTHSIPAHNHGTANDSVPINTPLMICIKE